MVCRKQIDKAAKQLKKNGGSGVDRANHPFDQLTDFSDEGEVRNYLLARENLVDSSHAERLFQKILLEFKANPKVGYEHLPGVKEMIAVLRNFLRGDETDYERVNSIHEMLIKLRYCLTAPDEIASINRLVNEVSYKCKFSYGDVVRTLRCRKCGWSISVAQKYGVIASGEVAACPNCTKGLRTNVEYQKELGGDHLIGKFGEFYLDGERPYTFIHEIKKVLPIPEDINYFPRDSQKGRLYSAEYKSRIFRDGIQFQDINEMQAYTDDLVASEEFRKLFGHLPALTVNRIKGEIGSYATLNSHIIGIADNMRNEYTLLHEIAHHITWNKPSYIKNKKQLHGAWFAYTLLQLVRLKMGGDAADKLEAAFDHEKVKWREGKEQFDEVLWVIT